MNIFINFKNYSSGIGEKQRELLDFLESISSSSLPTSFSISKNDPVSYPSHYPLPTTTYNLVVPTSELSPIWQKYNFPLWSQHCDPVKISQSTGWISSEMIKEAGGIGTMLNHSEHRLPFHVLKNTTQICHQHGLKVLICCENEKEAIIYSGLHPEYLAYEPPELIANKTQSVTSKSSEIQKILSYLKSSPTTYNLQPTTFLIGAGLHSREDINKSESLGAAGILIASSIMEGSHEEIKKLLN
jgi:triosephosphate isomerase (TIM)